MASVMCRAASPMSQDHVEKYQLRLSGVVWSLNEVTARPWHQHMSPCSVVSSCLMGPCGCLENLNPQVQARQAANTVLAALKAKQHDGHFWRSTCCCQMQLISRMSMAALKGVLQQPLYVIRKIPTDCISMLKEQIIGFRHVQSRLPDEPRSC